MFNFLDIVNPESAQTASNGISSFDLTIAIVGVAIVVIIGVASVVLMKKNK